MCQHPPLCIEAPTQNHFITNSWEAIWISWKPSLFYLLKYWGFSLSYWLITGICRTFCEFWLISRFWFFKKSFFFQLCFTSLRKPIHLINKNEWLMQSTSTFSCPQWTPRLIEWDRFVSKKLQIPWEKSIQNKEVCKGRSDQFSSGEIRKGSKGLWVQPPHPHPNTHTHTHSSAKCEIQISISKCLQTFPLSCLRNISNIIYIICISLFSKKPFLPCHPQSLQFPHLNERHH